MRGGDRHRQPDRCERLLDGEVEMTEILRHDAGIVDCDWHLQTRPIAALGNHFEELAHSGGEPPRFVGVRNPPADPALRRSRTPGQPKGVAPHPGTAAAVRGELQNLRLHARAMRPPIRRPAAALRSRRPGRFRARRSAPPFAAKGQAVRIAVTCLQLGHRRRAAGHGGGRLRASDSRDSRPARRRRRAGRGSRASASCDDRFTADVLARLPDLRAISKRGVGTDGREAAAARGVTNTPGMFDDEVADVAYAVTLLRLHRTVRSPAWHLPRRAGPGARACKSRGTPGGNPRLYRGVRRVAEDAARGGLSAEHGRLPGLRCSVTSLPRNGPRFEQADAECGFVAHAPFKQRAGGSR